MADAVPKTQKAAVKQGTGETATTEVKEIPVPVLQPGQILVKITYTGLCASDKSLIYDEWTASGLVMQPATLGIAGHEGAGVVVQVHDSAAHQWRVGDRAGIKWIASTCGECEFCSNGRDECHCPRQINSGFTAAGTFAEYVATDARYATRLPDGVKDEEAGPIMCGGVTAYVACKRTELRPGQWLVIPGAGGGLGHMAVQYAKAMGLRVIAVDGGDEKRDLCLKLGAEHFIDFTKTSDIPAEVTKLTTYGAHGVIVFGASRSAYETAPQVLRVRGRMVCVGLPKDGTIIAGATPFNMCLKSLEIVGSVVGTRRDVEEALDFTARGLVHPILTHGTLHDLNDLCHKMQEGKLIGRAVLKVGA